MSFQDELNSLKKKTVKVDPVEEMVEGTKKLIVDAVKYKASYCPAGTRLDCSFILNVPFVEQGSSSFQKETFFRNKKISLSFSVNHTLADPYLERLKQALRPYGIEVSGYFFTAMFKPDSEDETGFRHEFAYLYNDSYKSFWLLNGSMQNQSPTFYNLYSNLPVTLTEVGYRHVIEVHLNGKKEEVPCYPQLLLGLRYTETAGSSSQKRIVSCPYCSEKCKVPDTGRKLEVTCRKCGRRYIV